MKEENLFGESPMEKPWNRRTNWEMEEEMRKNCPELFARLGENFENKILLRERECDDLEKLFFPLPNYLHFYLNNICIKFAFI